MLAVAVSDGGYRFQDLQEFAKGTGSGFNSVEEVRFGLEAA